MAVFHLSDLSKNLPGSHVIGVAAFSHLSTDTRNLAAGDLFVALVGPNFDGHEFIAQAQNQGACAALVSTEIDTDLPLIVVPDTRIALGSLLQLSVKVSMVSLFQSRVVVAKPLSKKCYKRSFFRQERWRLPKVILTMTLACL